MAAITSMGHSVKCETWMSKLYSWKSSPLAYDMYWGHTQGSSSFWIFALGSTEVARRGFKLASPYENLLRMWHQCSLNSCWFWGLWLNLFGGILIFVGWLMIPGKNQFIMLACLIFGPYEGGYVTSVTNLHQKVCFVVNRWQQRYFCVLLLKRGASNYMKSWWIHRYKQTTLIYSRFWVCYGCDIFCFFDLLLNIDPLLTMILCLKKRKFLP